VIEVVDALWGSTDGGRIHVAVPVEDVDLLADVIVGADHDDLDRELLAIVRPDDLVFDLGASVGTFSLAAAVRGARVVAVEASPRRVEHLRLSAAVNSIPMFVEHAAVGRTAGTARYLSRRRDRRVVEGSSSKDLVVIPATTMGDLVALYGEPDVVRVNTPVWEIEVLDGCHVIGVRADLVATGERDWRRLLDGRSVTWLARQERRPLDLTRPHPEARMDILVGVEPTSDGVTDDERIARYETEAVRSPGAIRARLAADLRDGRDLLDAGNVQALLERLLLDPAERVVRAASWWRSHPARRTSFVDRAHALQAVLATRLSLD
jgi:FkbM family methyltransferase